MNKLPTKQIYLLTIIIVGIIALSVYSTYALFTFESSTSDVVTIHTPKSLNISENVYEYQQLTLEPNKVTTTDIDIYNSFEHEVCYSVWYKIVGDKDTEAKVQIFEKSNETLTSSGVLAPKGTIRVNIVIINDNKEQIKVNIGTIGSQKQESRCTLNLSDDKHVISSSYKQFDGLSTKLIEDNKNPKEIEENYLTYKDNTDIITFKNDDKILIADNFEYSKELFTLKESEELTFKELIDNKYLETKNIYFCPENETKCSILHKITKYEIEEIEPIEKPNLEQPEEKKYSYHITEYDRLIGYSKGQNGLRKINKKDYVFYGDNPNNYIYYNCLNNDDLTSCELWRIIGFFYNEETGKYNTKIVRNESIGKYQYDYKMEEFKNVSTNEWANANISKYLNEEYKLINNYDIYIEEYKQNLERITDLATDIKNIKIENEFINSKVNLLNLSDYLYTSSCEKNKINEYTGECITNNWLNNIEIPKEWTLTSKEVIEIIEEPEPEIEVEDEEDVETEEILENENIVEEELVDEEVEEINVINYVYSIGKNIEESDVNDSLEIRPVVFLKSRMLVLDGDGSFATPYIVK